MTAQEIHESLTAKYAESVLAFEETVLQPFIQIKPDKIDIIAQFLRDDEQMQFDFMSCLSGIDTGENLGVVYHLYSTVQKHKIVLRVEIPKEKPDVNSVAQIWRTADWHEREAYDMYGINFINHPDLSRILLPDDWEGFPLRKDYKQPEYYGGLRVPHPDQKEETNDAE